MKNVESKKYSKINAWWLEVAGKVLRIRDVR